MTRTPTAFEQALLEYINQARTHPDQVFDMLVADAQAGTGTQANITSALRYYGVDLDAFSTQMAAYSPVAPLAWNTALATAADGHTQLMIDTDTQSHRLPGEASLGQRITAAGYTNWGGVSENVYAYTQDPLYGHAGFMVDWGYDDEDIDGTTLLTDWKTIGDGMQDPAGHRVTIMSAKYVDIGISAIEETNSATSVGPWVVTQDFGKKQNGNVPHLLGVFTNDADKDGIYDIGEGLGGVTVTATGSAGTFTTTTWDSGGYQMELPTGSYTVRFSASGLDGSASYQVTLSGQNVKQDSTTDALRPDVIPVDPSALPATERPTVLMGTGTDADQLQGSSANNILLGDGLAATYFPEISAQVFRLYQATLGRTPDSAGHLGWTGIIALEGGDVLDVAKGFVGSSEFMARFGQLGNAEFVTLLYNNVLNRAPDASGLSAWTTQLNSGIDRVQVVMGFADSAEFIKTTASQATAVTLGNSPGVWSDDVYRLYQATLDRTPDIGGFMAWTTKLGTGMSFQSVADRFMLSTEFTTTYQNLDDSAFVDLLYRNVLSRDADATGLASWTALLNDGMTRARVVEGFSQSAEFVQHTAPDVAAWMRAQGVDDILTGGGGTDVLAGGRLSDTFVFERAASHSTVLDLEVWDTLDLSALGYTSLAEIRNDFTQSGANLIFDNGANTQITLLNFDLAQLTDEMILI